MRWRNFGGGDFWIGKPVLKGTEKTSDQEGSTKRTRARLGMGGRKIEAKNCLWLCQTKKRILEREIQFSPPSPLLCYVWKGIFSSPYPNDPAHYSQQSPVFLLSQFIPWKVWSADGVVGGGGAPTTYLQQELLLIVCTWYVLCPLHCVRRLLVFNKGFVLVVRGSNSYKSQRLLWTRKTRYLVDEKPRM